MKYLSNLTALYGVLSFVAGAVQPDRITLQGTSQTSNVSQTMTLGSANIRLKLPLGAEVQLQCGILGVLQGTKPDGTLLFQHTVTCNDRSIFSLSSHTVISGVACTPPAVGLVGTFHEDSTLFGVAGPYAGRTGQVTIDGTVNCGFNQMTIAGSINPVP